MQQGNWFPQENKQSVLLFTTDLKKVNNIFLLLFL